MEVVASSASPPLLVVSNVRKENLRAHISVHSQKSFNNPRVFWNYWNVSNTIVDHFGSSLRCSAFNSNGRMRCCKPVKGAERVLRCSSLFQPLWTLHSISSQYILLLISYGNKKVVEFGINIYKMKCWQEKFRQAVNIVFIRVVVSMMLIMSVSITVGRTPSWALTEENLLFLEAWRTVDRAFYDKTFNGQAWFRYREDALRNEPMNTQEETYMAIRKMLLTLDDPFTRFLEPEKFKSLRAVWHPRCLYRCRAVNWLSDRA